MPAITITATPTTSPCWPSWASISIASSIEWARVEPEEGEFSPAELEHYRRMLIACHEHHITPMVTFHHFTSPRWVIAQGGWEAATTPAKFARYCERATRYLGDLVGAACTINEANIGPLITSLGFIPPAEILRQAPCGSAAAKASGIAPSEFAPFNFATSTRARDTIMEAHRRRCPYRALSDKRLNHQVEVLSGVLEEECSEILKRFFRNRR